MDLTQTSLFSYRDWGVVGFDSWAGDLRAACGSFQPVAVDTRAGVRGMAKRVELPGLTFAHVVNNLETISRTPKDVRRDDEEVFFLLMQIEGACGVEQGAAQVMLAEGDCTLVDSTRPLNFYFGGRHSNQISLHLPRRALLHKQDGRSGGLRRLEAADPMAVVLRALVVKLAADPNEVALGALLLDAASQAFRGLPVSTEPTQTRLQRALLLIEQHLTEPSLDSSWLAARLKVSLRTLQDDFRPTGQTCTEVIRERRLRWIEARLRSGTACNRETIAALAFAAGFNDISYFNRSFRALFGCAPGDVVTRR